MDVTLESIAHCFHGIVPSLIATSTREGEPNVAFLSHVYYVDSSHVALSCQFFNKTRSNVLENPHACVEINDPFTFQAYRLELRFSHAETEGELYDRMRSRLDTIAFHTGMRGVFRLLSADIYQVLSLTRINGYLTDMPADSPRNECESSGPVNEIRMLQFLSARINAAESLEQLLEDALLAFEQGLGFPHAMVLLLDEAGNLFTVASRGYGASGIGAEVRLGAGILGRAAAEKRILRVAGMTSDLRYGRAVRDQVNLLGELSVRPEIPLPGLKDVQSQLAIPLVIQDRVIGVFAAESSSPLQFEHWHSEFLEIIANHFALALDRMLQRDDHEPGQRVARQGAVSVLVGSEMEAFPGDVTSSETIASDNELGNEGSRNTTHVFWFFPNDDCVFVNGEYLIRNVPGRILWRLLCDFHLSGRREFSNRELRLDQTLRLPQLRDNLESRLILLRRRLEEKCPQVRLVPIRRGKFGLQIQGRVELVERGGADS